jgi:hypothetical protein
LPLLLPILYAEKAVRQTERRIVLGGRAWVDGDVLTLKSAPITLASVGQYQYEVFAFMEIAPRRRPKTVLGRIGKHKIQSNMLDSA